MEEAVSAGGIAVNGRGVPGAAAGGGKAAGVQARSDRSWRGASCIVAEHPAHHLSLGLVDFSKARPKLAVGIELALDLAAIDPPASVSPLLGDAGQAAAGLARGLSQEEGVHRALEADRQLFRFAFRRGADGDAVVAKILNQGGRFVQVAWRCAKPLSGRVETPSAPWHALSAAAGSPRPSIAHGGRP